ncbi:hypothetical protein KB206_14870 [Microvirga sp. STS02]|uniref:hypothetical protein n=1 Tax=Hymenobacter negativus TaxID=2795026 RepID=UPI0018DEAF4E|nr:MULTISPECIES: hypothetical protein [Bacteria]MBH8570171.1 hypothetical protein [Hymenobacter negativus]MBR7209911.1 hypothetical protein [Microvirga sp. STS02]
MPNSIKILSATLEVLADFWRDQAILAVPDKSWNPQAVAQANGVTLPDDFVALYTCSNGMNLSLERSQSTDKAGFYSISVEELRTEQRELVVDSMSGTETIITSVTPFFDYMHWSWQYAFIPNPTGDGYQIGIMSTDTSFKVITSSLATFLSLYMENAQVLYDYSRPWPR